MFIVLLARVYAPNHGHLDAFGRYAHHVPTTFTATERESLAARGLAPNTFRTLTHDEAVARLLALATVAGERTAAGAFVASLGSAPVMWRAPLPALALAATQPEHAFTGIRTCDVCFVDSSVTIDVTGAWYQWQTNGSPVPGDVVRYVLALEQAPPPWPGPQPYDVWVLHEILDTLRALPPTTRSGGAVTALRAARLLPTASKYGYSSLLEDLSLLGVLQTTDHPGLLTRFTTARERDQRPSARTEVSAPLSFWRAADGVAQSLVDRLFGHLPRPAARPAPPTVEAPARAKARPAPLTPDLKGEARAGDVYAVGCREDAWVLAFCHRVEARGGRPYGLVEYLDALFTTAPAADLIAGLGFRGRRGARWQQWTSQLEKTPRVRRLARDVPCPDEERPLPDRIPAGNATDLRYLAGHCFLELDA